MTDGFLKVMHYATLPGAAALFCVLVFMADERRRGRLLMLTLSAALSLNTLLKALFRIPRPWLMHAENAPLMAEGGYAFPCMHTQLIAGVLCAFALTSRRRWVRFLCAAGICLTAAVRIWAGLQSAADAAAGLAAGLLCAVLLCRFWYYGKKGMSRFITAGIFPAGLCAAVFFRDAWGAGLALTAAVLGAAECVFSRADNGRTRFGILYGTLFSAGIYAGLYIFLPFLVEWLVTAQWPGQMLIVFLITLLPCLLKVFPLF